MAADSGETYVFQVLYESNLDQAGPDFARLQQVAAATASSMGELSVALGRVGQGPNSGLVEIFQILQAMPRQLVTTAEGAALLRSNLERVAALGPQLAALSAEFRGTTLGASLGVANPAQTEAMIRSLREGAVLLDQQVATEGRQTTLKAENARLEEQVTAATAGTARAEEAVAAATAKTTEELGRAAAAAEALNAAARAGVGQPLLPKESGPGRGKALSYEVAPGVNISGGPGGISEEAVVAERLESLAAQQSSIDELRDRLNQVIHGGAATTLGSTASGLGTTFEGDLSERKLQLLRQTLITRLEAANEFFALPGDLKPLSRQLAVINSVEQAELAVATQQQRVADAAKKQAARAEAEAGRGGGGVGGFFRGLTGQSGFDGGFGSQLGATFKYIAFYEAFILITRGVVEAFNATAEYERAVTNLSISMGSTREQATGLARDLATIGNNNGITGAQAINAGVSYQRAFPEAPKDQAGFAGASTAASLNIIGDPKTVDANTQQVLATLKNFELGVGSYTRVLDVATVAAQQFGLAGPNDILPGLAQIGDLAKATGFSLEETAALIAGIRQRTGESADAAAGELRRILGREGNPAFQQIFAGFGISQTASFRDQLAAFAPIFNRLSSQAQAGVIGQIGGGRAGAAGEVVAEFKAIEDAAKKAGDSEGAASQQETARLNDLHGLLSRLSGDWNHLATAIGESGLLDIFGLALAGLDPLLKGITAILDTFNAMPKPLREVLITLTEIAALYAVLGKESLGQAVSNLLAIPGSGAGFKGVGAALGIGKGAEEAASFIGPAGETVAIDTAAAATGAEGIAAAGSALLPIAAVAGVAIAGLIAIGAVKSAFDNLNRAADTATKGGLGNPTTAADLAAKSSQFATAATQTNAGAFGDLVTGGRAAQDFNTYTQISEFYKAQAARAAEDVARTPADTSLLGTFGADRKDYASGLKALESSSVGAADRARILAQAIDGVGISAHDAAGKVTASNETLLTLGNAGYAAVQQQVDAANTPPGETFGGHGQTRRVPGSLPSGFDDQKRNDFNAAFEKYIDDHKLTDQDLTTAQVRKAAQAAAASLPKVTPEVRQAAVQAIVDAYQNISSAEKGLNNGGLSPEQAAALLDDKTGLAKFLSDQDSLINAMTNPSQQVATASLGLQTAMTVYARAVSSGASPETLAGLAQQVASATETNNKELLNALGLRVGHIKSELNTAGLKANEVLAAQNRTQSQIFAAVRGYLVNVQGTGIAQTGDVQGTASALGNLTRGQVARLRDAAVKAANVLKTFYQDIANLENASYQYMASLAAQGQGGLYGGDQGGANRAAAEGNQALNRAKKSYQDAQKTADTYNAAIPYTSYTADPTSSSSAAAGDTPAQIAAARAEAQAIPGDDLSQARAALRAAQINLAAAKKGSVEYWNDLKALHEAQYQLATVEQKLANEKYLLGHDVTNPVVQATAKVLADLAKLRYDARRGANTIDDKLTVKTDEASLARTKFDQKLQDEQTNYELGRISYQSYISYLQSQHNLLSAIKVKTRDQIEELNSVDQALKAAANALQGQFNIGDIKVPTIYEVRRSIAASAAGQNYSQNTTNYVQIDGTDTALIQQVLERLLGATASQTRTTAGRK